MAFQPVCDGSISISVDGYATCSTGWLTGAYIAPFEFSSLDPVMIGLMVGQGFFILIPLWMAVFGGRAILNVIRG